MKNVFRGVLVVAALALPSLALAAEPVKKTWCALCAACGLGCC